MSEIILSTPIETVEEAREAPSRTYSLDLDRGRIVGNIDGIEAVSQAIRKAIITPRFKCLIYDNQYGSEIEAAVIQSQGRANRDYIEAVVPGFVRDALRPDSRVTLAYNFVFAFTPEEKAERFPELFDLMGDEGDTVFVAFDADTIYGTVQIKEVI